MKIQMDEEWRKRWVTALRSGKYPQCRELLRRQRISSIDGHHDYSYCCLGVLCDISGLGNFKDESSSRFVTLRGDGSASTLPESLAHVIGLSDGAQRYLTEQNDVQCLTLGQIADIIEGVDTNEPL